MHLLDNWVLDKPIDVFFFDCDSTLSLIEGIDELAKSQGLGEQVSLITKRCMEKTGLSISEYKARLDLVKPHAEQVSALAALYSRSITPGVLELIQVLQSLNKKIYVISAGIKMAVSAFAQQLGIPAEHVLAVDVYFDEKGCYQGFDEQSFLVSAQGKPRQIRTVLQSGERSVLVGDGVSDWEASEVVTRFIGFAGLASKAWVRSHSNFYIDNKTLYSVIPLSLTIEEVAHLGEPYHAYYEEGMRDIRNSLVLIKDVNHV